jgi:hypothetical protein
VSGSPSNLTGIKSIKVKLMKLTTSGQIRFARL